MSEPGFNINNFIKGSSDQKKLEIEIYSDPEAPPKKTTAKRGRKKSTETTPAVIDTPPIAETSMSYIQQNIPYANAYQETNKQLDDSIAQLNLLGSELVIDLQTIRSSKTLRNKYGLINDITATAASIVSSKIAAIREKNKSIEDVNRLELARLKELKTQANAEDDNTRIANMYDAFINTPVGVGRATLGPAIQDMTMYSADNQDFSRMAIGYDQDTWEQNLDPAQNRMVLEAKGAIETVVMYDDVSGNRWFEVVDKTTRQPVPNVEKPDSTYIYDLDINIRGGFAKDSNRNVVYPLVVLHNTESMSEY